MEENQIPYHSHNGYDSPKISYNNITSKPNSIDTLLGDGSDGDVYVGTDTTLARDMFYNNLTVPAGVTLNTGGYRIFVKNTLTNDGTISRNGNNGGNGGNGAASANSTAGTAGAKLADGTLSGGVAGTAGGTGTTDMAGAPSNAGTDATCLGNDGVRGGRGGASATKTYGSAGVEGQATAETLKLEKLQCDLSLTEVNEGYFEYLVPKTSTNDELLSASAGSTGGGGGGGYYADPTEYSGGAGGGGGSTGGVIYIAAKKLTNNGTISANGGNGGNGGNGVAGKTGGGGGGGAGSGGIILLIYNSITPGTITVSGGSGGESGVGVNPGVYGDDGLDGKIIKVIIN